MPFYEYECVEHGIFEVQQSIKDEPLVYCPICLKENKQTTIKKLISLSSFSLQGGGWASTGYSK